MSTLDTVFLIITACTISLFFLIMTGVGIAVWRLVGSVKRVVFKAEDMIDSVESAAEVLKDARGRLTLFKLIKNIIKMTNKGR